MSDDDEREAMFDDDEMEAGRQGCRKPSKGRQTPVSNSKKKLNWFSSGMTRKGTWHF
jgi:hypothetical protein